MKNVLRLSLTVALMQPLSAAAGEAAATQSTAVDPLKSVRACLTHLHSTDRFSGAMLITRNETPVLEFAASVPATGQSITLDTPINVASIGKMFTAVAIAQLVDEGKIRFEDPIASYVKGLPPEMAGARISHALTHTAGFQGLNLIRPEIAEKLSKADSITDVVPLVVGAGLAFEPGTSSAYSNADFYMLGAVIEAVTGKKYQDYVREKVFTPAGMLSTSFTVPAAAAPRLTRFSQPGAPPSENRKPTNMGGPSPAGGSYSTVRDLGRFAEAVKAGRLLSAKQTAEVTSPKKGSDYGYGFGIAGTGAAKRVGHNGGSPGTNGELWWSLDDGWVVATLANIDPPAATNATNFAILALTDPDEATPERCEKIGSRPGPFDRRRAQPSSGAPREISD